MFGFRTPLKNSEDNDRQGTEGAGAVPVDTLPSLSTPGSPTPPPPPKPKTKMCPTSQDGGTARRTSVEGVGSTKPQRYASRTAEARACLEKAIFSLNSARNLKTDIKTTTTAAIERLYYLVKEAEAAGNRSRELEGSKVEEVKTPPPSQPIPAANEYLKNLEEHKGLMKEHCEKLEALKEIMEGHQTTMREQMDNLQSTIKDFNPVKYTYAQAAANPRMPHTGAKPPLHSIVISSEDVNDTSTQVIEKIRTAVNATECGFRVDKLRKAGGQKVVLGCGTRGETERITNKIKESNSNLKVEPTTNKDPLIVLLNVLKVHNDGDIIKALSNHNKHLLVDLKPEEVRIGVRYRKRARNPLQNHIVLQVSPLVWRRLTDTGMVYIDLQPVTVKDQSPLVQCSLCLGYGHARRYCTQTLTKCSHCGGPHTRTECADWLAGHPPVCCNCTQANLDQRSHNVFSGECAVRQKWDALARAAVAYC